MLTRSERDALLLDISQLRCRFIIGLDLELILHALVKALPLDEPLTGTVPGKEIPGGMSWSAGDFAPAATAPDFAAMAHELWGKRFWGNPEPVVMIEKWLAANWPKPPPAPVERDEAWWRTQSEFICRIAARKDIESFLRKTFAAPVAFDVEALAKRAQHLHDCNSSVTVKECVLAAAREMGVR